MAVSENAELEELIRKATGETASQLPPTPGAAITTDQDDAESSLDLNTLALVARRSLVWVLLLLALGFTASWLFLRYTKPVYKAASILKLDERSEAANLGFGAAKSGDNPSNQLAGEIELIKSNLTYKHLKERIALDVNYYVQGTVLENELYDTAPFHVKYKVADPALYNRKFLVNFLTPTKYQVSVNVRNQILTGTYTVGQWATFSGMQLLLESVPGRALPVGDDPQYHFVILDEGSLSELTDRYKCVTRYSQISLLINKIRPHR